jgi:hypothetical protein
MRNGAARGRLTSFERCVVGVLMGMFALCIPLHVGFHAAEAYHLHAMSMHHHDAAPLPDSCAAIFDHFFVMTAIEDSILTYLLLAAAALIIEVILVRCGIFVRRATYRLSLSGTSPPPALHAWLARHTTSPPRA